MNEYEKARNEYRPKKTKIIFIPESPPDTKKGKKARYFYFEHGASSLFRSIMEVLFPEDYKNFVARKISKKDLLLKFQHHGYFLIDACGYPINQLPKEKDKNAEIKRNANKLIKELTKNAKLVLIKKNVYQMLFRELRGKGFNAINNNFLPFPSYGHQKKFRYGLRELLKSIRT